MKPQVLFWAAIHYIGLLLWLSPPLVCRAPALSWENQRMTPSSSVSSIAECDPVKNLIHWSDHITGNCDRMGEEHLCTLLWGKHCLVWLHSICVTGEGSWTILWPHKNCGWRELKGESLADVGWLLQKKSAGPCTLSHPSVSLAPTS